MPNKTARDTNPHVLHEIERALNGIRFGSLEITLHDGQITQIERREKIRLPLEHEPASSGSCGRRGGGASAYKS